jgi:hypothetical protein
VHDRIAACAEAAVGVVHSSRSSACILWWLIGMVPAAATVTLAYRWFGASLKTALVRFGLEGYSEWSKNCSPERHDDPIPSSTMSRLCSDHAGLHPTFTSRPG